MRIIVSFVVAFLVAAAAGKCLIPALRRMKAGQSIKEIGPTWHMSKQGTPTMGGLMFIIAIAAAVLTVGWSDIAAGYRGGLFVFLFALVFGIIGYVDDYCKVKKKQNTGLTAPQKFLLQLAAAILFTVLMRYEGYLQNHLYIPFFNVTFSIPWPADTAVKNSATGMVTPVARPSIPSVMLTAFTVPTMTKAAKTM